MGGSIELRPIGHGMSEYENIGREPVEHENSSDTVRVRAQVIGSVVIVLADANGGVRG
jgi:hypothetical protein